MHRQRIFTAAEGKGPQNGCAVRMEYAEPQTVGSCSLGWRGSLLHSHETAGSHWKLMEPCAGQARPWAPVLRSQCGGHHIPLRCHHCSHQGCSCGCEQRDPRTCDSSHPFFSRQKLILETTSRTQNGWWLGLGLLLLDLSGSMGLAAQHPGSGCAATSFGGTRARSCWISRGLTPHLDLRGLPLRIRKPCDN